MAAAVVAPIPVMADVFAPTGPCRSDTWMNPFVRESPDGLLALDDHGVVRFANPAAETMTGVPVGTSVGRPFASLFHRDDQFLATDLIEDLVASAARQAQVSLGAGSEGSQTRVLDVVLRDTRREPAVGGFIVTLRDVTVRAEIDRDLRHRIAHDQLTGAVSRGEFLDRLELAVEDPRGAHRLGLLFVDVDHFKAVNDRFGHHVGDRTLISVCRLIQRSVRDGDIVARFGGDEFVALLRNVPSERALVEAGERLVEQVRLHGQVDQEILAVTVSVGGARNAGDDAPGLLPRADHAPLDAKGQGLDRVVFVSPDT